MNLHKYIILWHWKGAGNQVTRVLLACLISSEHHSVDDKLGYDLLFSHPCECYHCLHTTTTSGAIPKLHSDFTDRATVGSLELNTCLGPEACAFPQLWKDPRGQSLLSCEFLYNRSLWSLWTGGCKHLRKAELQRPTGIKASESIDAQICWQGDR